MTESTAPSRLLAVNIGNTNLSFALFEERQMKWVRWMPVERAHRAGSAMAAVKDIADVVIASVNPACTRRVAAIYRRATHRGVLNIGNEVPIPIVNLTDEPKQVGADRLLNALAAHRRCKGPAIVVDVGTAITFDLLSKRGEFMGGLIAPGMRISALALSAHTAQLPRVQMKRPRGLFGKNTEEAIRSGVYWGTISVISGVTAMLQKKLDQDIAFFLTGGPAPLLAPHLPSSFIHLPHLTLEGILWAYEACVHNG